MKTYQLMQIRRQVMRALSVLGAQTGTVQRVEKDLNGMPTGRVLDVCTLYGMAYTKAADAPKLVLDVPGVTLSQDSLPKVVGVCVQGELPQSGDELTLGDKKGTVLRAEERLGVWSLCMSFA